MKKILYFLLAIGTLNAVAQSSAITPQGTTFPNISLSTTSDVSKTPSPLVSQLVYNTNGGITGAGAEGAGYYFWNGTAWKKLAIAPVSGGGGSLPTTGIVLSETETNTPLANAGFSLLGKVNNLTFQAYSPSTPSAEWHQNTTYFDVPTGRNGYSACMLNNKMFIWGGFRNNSGGSSTFYNTGALYTPVSDLWTATSTTNILARMSHSTVCYGDKAIVWGGSNGSNYVNTGDIYNATTNTWASISPINAPSARVNNSAVWTGTEMLIWGGISYNGPPVTYSDGGKYNPVTNTWIAVSNTNAPSARYGHSAVWTGSKMIVWGGYNGTTYLNDGGVYDPATNTWTTISTINAPSARSGHKAVWTGTKMIVLGGYTPNAAVGGALYDIVTNSWITTNTGSAILGALYAVMLDTKVLVVGSENPTRTELFDPSANAWQSISNNSFAPQYLSSLVSFGNSAISWGGSLYNQFNGTYNYYNAGSVILPSAYQSVQNLPFYLFKKD